MTVARFPSLAHWGAFTALVENGRVIGCEPFARDPAPSEMLEAIPAMVHSPLRIARPAIRDGWREGKERTGADSIVVPAKWEAVCKEVIKQERIITHGRVAAGGKVTIERSIANGGVWIAISVELERLGANCRVVAGKAGTGRVIVSERKGAHSSVVFGVAVEGESVNSDGRVVIAAEVEDHRCSANCGIGISSIEDQRSSANTGVEAAATD